MKMFFQAIVLLLLSAPACAWVIEHQQELLTYSAATYDWYKTQAASLAPTPVPSDGTWSNTPAISLEGPIASTSAPPFAGLSLGSPALWETPALSPTPAKTAPAESNSPSSTLGNAATWGESESSAPATDAPIASADSPLFPFDPEVIERAVEQAQNLIAQAGSSYAPPASNIISTTSGSTPIFETSMQTGSDATVRWYRGPQTTDKQSFEYALVGKGDFKVMILGSLYGDETSSALFMDRLLFNLNKNIKPEQDLQVLLIRSGNPDGLKFARATNASNVLLDQNFIPAPQVAAGQQAVAKPANQPETVILTRYISEFKPSRVLHVRTTRNNRGMIEYGTHDESIAALVSQQSDYVIESLEGKVPANSLAAHVLSDKSRSYVNVYLPLGNHNVDDAWMQHRQMILNSLKPQKLDGLSILKQKLQQQAPSQSPVNLMKPEGIPVSNENLPGQDPNKVVPFGVSFGKEPMDPLSTKGSVELLPSPAEFKDSTVDPRNIGYFELPPPPGAQ
jgi:hypothetical protein